MPHSVHAISVGTGIIIWLIWFYKLITTTLHKRILKITYGAIYFVENNIKFVHVFAKTKVVMW